MPLVAIIQQLRGSLGVWWTPCPVWSFHLTQVRPPPLQCIALQSFRQATTEDLKTQGGCWLNFFSATFSGAMSGALANEKVFAILRDAGLIPKVFMERLRVYKLRDTKSASPILSPNPGGIHDLPDQFWKEAQLVIWPHDPPSVP